MNSTTRMYELATRPSVKGSSSTSRRCAAMVRPKQYPKATWKILMQGADLYAKAASACVAAAQAAIATRDTSGFPKVSIDWNVGNDLVGLVALASSQSEASVNAKHP